MAPFDDPLEADPVAPLPPTDLDLTLSNEQLELSLFSRRNRRRAEQRDVPHGEAGWDQVHEIADELGLRQDFAAARAGLGGSECDDFFNELTADLIDAAHRACDPSRALTVFRHFRDFALRIGGGRVPTFSLFIPLCIGGEAARTRNQLMLTAFRNSLMEGREGVSSDTIDGYVSALKVYLEIESAGPITSGNDHNTVGRYLSKAYRKVIGPSDGRKYVAGVGGADIAALRENGLRTTADFGWHDRDWGRSASRSRRPSTRAPSQPARACTAGERCCALGVCAASYDAFMRGGEPGTVDGAPWDPDRGLTLDSVAFFAPKAALPRPHLVLDVMAIKDVNFRHRRVPNYIVCRCTRGPATDPTCSYCVICEYMPHRLGLAPGSAVPLRNDGHVAAPGLDRTRPLFLLPDGTHWQTRHVAALAKAVARATGVDEEHAGAKSFRIRAATDLADSLGEAGCFAEATAAIKANGRWASDIHRIYTRTTIASQARFAGPRASSPPSPVPTTAIRTRGRWTSRVHASYPLDADLPVPDPLLDVD